MSFKTAVALKKINFQKRNKRMNTKRKNKGKSDLGGS